MCQNKNITYDIKKEKYLGHCRLCKEVIKENSKADMEQMLCGACADHTRHSAGNLLSK